MLSLVGPQVRVAQASVLLTCVLVAVAQAEGAEKVFIEQKRSVFVDNVWTGASAGFQMTTRGDRQYVAYYDAQGQMTIASRSLGSEEWQRKKLDDKVLWDSHNYVTFGFDSERHLHVSGNMHASPLRYYRTARPGDVTSLVGIHTMTGHDEGRVTYPRFFGGPNGEFLFTYRDGSSGRGRKIINVYDVKGRSWSRYLEKPLIDGQGKMGQYQSGPARDRSGTYHLVWVWRDHSGCEMNHDVTYARSPGTLDNWENSDGTPIKLPLTIENAEIIDRVPVKAGLLNSAKLSFDAEYRPMATYIKYDPRGRTQIYTMRLEGSRWKRYQTTDWTDRWDFSGGGSIKPMITFSGPAPFGESGRLYQVFINKFLAPYMQIRFLDAEKLQPVGESTRLFPPGFDTPEPDKEGDWQVNTSGFSMGRLFRDGRIRVLRWEAMAPNRDRPRDSIPPPSKLEVVGLGIKEP